MLIPMIAIICQINSFGALVSQHGLPVFGSSKDESRTSYYAFCEDGKAQYYEYNRMTSEISKASQTDLRNIVNCTCDKPKESHSKSFYDQYSRHCRDSIDAVSADINSLIEQYGPPVLIMPDCYCAETEQHGEGYCLDSMQVWTFMINRAEGRHFDAYIDQALKIRCKTGDYYLGH